MHLHFFILSFFHFARRSRWHKTSVHVGFRDEGTGVHGVLSAAHGEDTIVLVSHRTHYGYLVCTLLASSSGTCHEFVHVAVLLEALVSTFCVDLGNEILALGVHEEGFTVLRAVHRTNAWGHPWLKVGRSFEELFNNLRYGNFKQIGQAIRNRWNILTKRNQYK